MPDGDQGLKRKAKDESSEVRRSSAKRSSLQRTDARDFIAFQVTSL